MIGMATQLGLSMGQFSQKTETTHSSMIMPYFRNKGDPIKEDFEITMLDIL